MLARLVLSLALTLTASSAWAGDPVPFSIAALQQETPAFYQGVIVGAMATLTYTGMVVCPDHRITGGVVMAEMTALLRIYPEWREAQFPTVTVQALLRLGCTLGKAAYY
jgi:hypothetical protein